MGDTYTELKPYLQNAHVYNFTLKTLTYILEKSGFELIDGTEEIKAIFKKKEKAEEAINEDYLDILKYLSTTRRYKYWYKIKKFSPKSATMNILLASLRKSDRLYLFSRNLYRKYIKQ